MSEHDELHTWLGAYVLGALDHAERDELERHLARCERCSDEVASLSPLPGLLARAEPRRAGGGSIDVVDDVVTEIVDGAARTRRSRARWRAIAIAAVVALGIVGAIVAWPFGEDAEEGRRLAVGPTDVPGAWVSVISRPWGTEIAIGAEALPSSGQYALLAIDTSGRDRVAATWGPTDGPMRLQGAAAIPSGDLAQVIVVDDAGRELFSASTSRSSAAPVS